MHDLSNFKIQLSHGDDDFKLYDDVIFSGPFFWKFVYYVYNVYVAFLGSSRSRRTRRRTQAMMQFSMPDLKPYLMYDKELSSSIYRGVNRGIHIHREERNKEMLQMLFHTRGLPIAMNAMISWAFCSWWWWW